MHNFGVLVLTHMPTYKLSYAYAYPQALVCTCLPTDPQTRAFGVTRLANNKLSCYRQIITGLSSRVLHPCLTLVFMEIGLFYGEGPE